MNSTLEALLTEGQQFDPLYLPSMNSDHMPMTLVAMAHLGATDDDLVAYQERHRQRLRPVDADPDFGSIS